MAEVKDSKAVLPTVTTATNAEPSTGKKIVAQFGALMRKNFLVQKRNVGATLAQLFVGPLFLIVLFIISEAIKINQSGVQEIQFVEHPKPIEPSTVPTCTPYEGKECYDFAYAPKTAATDKFVKSMREASGIPEGKVFGITGNVNEWLLSNENKTRLVLHLPSGDDLFSTSVKFGAFAIPRFAPGDGIPTKTFEYTIQMNQTGEPNFFSAFGSDPEPMEIEYRAPMQMLVQTALLRYYNMSEAYVKTEYKNFPHPAILVGYDAVRDSGATLLFIAAAFNFVVQMYLIVEEKQHKLRYAMEKVGMYDSLYWITWYVFDCLVNLVVVGNLMLFGLMFNLELFHETSGGLTFLHFWLSACSFTAVGFCLASLSSKVETATSFGLLYFCICYLFGPILFTISFSSGATDPVKIIRDTLLIVPAFGPAALFFGGLDKLIDASSGQSNTGMEWVDRFNNVLPPSEDENEWSFENFLTYQLIMIVYHLLLAWYFDNVLPNAYGRRKSLVFFLNPRYWCGQRAVIPKQTDATYTPKEGEDEDVTKEANRIMNRDWEEGSAPAIILEGFSKTFFSGMCNSGEGFKAVDEITYGVEQDSAFVLLGHNGAGKTTTINMLVGNLEITKGTGLVVGYNAKTQMRSINQIMGVCPQHDILWPGLTGAEHLELFCRLRGMSEEEVAKETQQRLKDVLLDDPKVRNTPARAYSGGMQRRLSIAISLIGNPKVVYLDEPTTGMDPVTRREVWDMIQRAKKGRVIVLTTHSMEEADVLGDNIGVMSHGKIQAFGSSTRLKKRFGSGYKMTVFIDNPLKEKEATEFLKNFEDSNLGLKVSCTVESRVPRGEKQGPVLFLSLPKVENELTMTPFFKALEERKEEFGIGDFSVGLSTLEEVFLELSKRDHFIPGVTKQYITQQCSIAGLEVTAGAVIATPDQWGRTHNLTITDEHIKAGVINFQVEIPQEEGKNEAVTDANKLEVDVKERIRGTRVPVSFQAKALCIKTLQWQRKHKCQLLANICFPIFICIVAFLIEVLVVSLIREETLCGTGVKYKDCKEKGYNLTCVEKRLMGQYEFKQSVPLTVGEIDYYGFGGIGINPNCGTDESGDRTCFDGIEKPRFDNILSTSADTGPTRTITEDPEVKAVYQKFRTLIASSKCVEEYNAALRCQAQGRGASNSYCSERRRDNTCQKECREVNKVKAKAEAADEASLAQQSNPLSSCLPEEGTRRRLQKHERYGDSKGRRMLELTKEEQEYYDIYLKIKDKKIACDKEFMKDIATILDNNGKNIAGKIATAKGTIKATGVYESMRATNPPGSSYGQMFSEEPILDEGVSQFLGAIKDQLNKAGLDGFKAGAPGGPVAFCRSIPYNQFSLFGDKHLKSNITKIFSKNMTHPTDFAIDNFCSLMLNLDVARGLSFENVANTEALDDALYKRWNGKEVGPEYDELVKKQKTLGYRWHYYDADYAAIDWKKYDDAKGQYSYTLYHNTTATERIDTQNWMALTQWVNNAILRKQKDIQSSMMTQRFPVKFKCNRDEWLDDRESGKTPLDCPALLFSFLRLSIVDFFMESFMPFFMIVYGYSMTVLLAYEKEQKLKIIMKMQGLKMSVYFWVNYFYFLGQFMLLCFIISLFGYIAKTNLFRLHDYGVMLTFFFVWGNVLVAFFMTLATCFKTTRMAQTMTFMFILICIYIGSTVIRSIVLNPNATESSYTLMMMVPPFVMIRLSNTLTLAAATNTKISMETMTQINNGTIGIGLNYLIGHWFVWMFLRWYLEQVLAVGFGTTRHPLFIFTKQFWMEEVFGNEQENKKDALNVDKLEKLPASEIESGLELPPDVEAEHQRIIGTMRNGEDTSDALRVVNLHKKFAPIGNAPAKTAVRSVSFGVKRRECFGLLGHNGAGKTTVINMMTGLFPPTSGTGLVGQYNIQNNMENIYSEMGICPQHNIIWGELTAESHQYFFGRLKGQKGAALKNEVKRNLEAVNLAMPNLKNRGAAGFSGGMQRRLSVANSIVGNPSVVYMDEPSTGLDPASRRQLWDVISKAKRDKSVILTTHSMEEADVLCDHLGIMSGGRLLCLGPAYDLKRRFGKGYTCVVSTKIKNLSNRDEIHSWMTGMFPSATLLEEPISGTFKYEISRKDVIVSDAFEKIVTQKDSVGVTDWGFTETTLEEVFLKLSHLHGNENPQDMISDKKVKSSSDNVKEVEMTEQKQDDVEA